MRLSERELSNRRADRSTRFLVTGASGFVGSHIAVSLLNAGYRVTVLCRPSGSRSAAERFRHVLGWHGLEPGPALDVVDGDVCQDKLGLPVAEFAALSQRIDEIVHCASHTSFLEKHQTAIYETNVNGTLRLLELAEAGCCSFFHYMSTAYAVGKSAGSCLEIVRHGTEFNNPYEASKNEAERAITCRCAAGGIGTAILRPSIIIGDSVRGRTLLFNAMYYPVKMVHFMAESLREDIRSNGGMAAAELGVEIRNDGTMHLPIRLQTHESGVLNIVPIDFVINAFRAILENGTPSGVYHLVNKTPTSLAQVTEFSSEYFRLSGITSCTGETFEAAPRTAIERRLDTFFKIYQPYMSDTRRFDSARADAVLERARVMCPPIDYGLFRRCIDYAMECGWTDPGV
jgi:nucleoside-diphosphate-sugar epimerase